MVSIVAVIFINFHEQQFSEEGYLLLWLIIEKKIYPECVG